MAKVHLVLLAALLVGCGQYPNPNDLTAIAPESRAEIANKRLEAAATTLDFKVLTGEISDERRNDLIRELAEDLLKKVDPAAVPDSDQWMYAALLRVTGRWPDAEVALKKAVKVASGEDRRVNDTLKLALAEAKNREVADAIASAKSVMDAADVDAAPILPAILLEIVPAAEGQGHDKELADLLVGAIACHERVKVDANSEAGKTFLIARRYHINQARMKIDELSSSRS